MISSFEQNESMLYKTTVDEIEAVLEVSIETIKKWVLHFDIKSEKDENGHRYYSEETIKIFEKIKSFVAQGYPLEDIESFLKLKKYENNLADNVEIKTEQAMATKPLMTQTEKFQSKACDLFIEKDLFLEKNLLEQFKLIAKIEILEVQKHEMESQLNEYKNILNAKDKTIHQLEKHFADYAKLKQNTKWWHF